MKTKLKMKSKENERINEENNCLNCPAAIILGKVNFNSCGQTMDKSRSSDDTMNILIRCVKRPELGIFEPTITFDQCPIWINEKNKFVFKEYPILTIRKIANEHQSRII